MQDVYQINIYKAKTLLYSFLIRMSGKLSEGQVQEGLKAVAAKELRFLGRDHWAEWVDWDSLPSDGSMPVGHNCYITFEDLLKA